MVKKPGKPALKNVKSRLNAIMLQYPTGAFISICYIITWVVWLAIPTFAGNEWPLIKTWVGVGMGPGLAAVILDYVRGTGATMFTRRWWILFITISGITFIINLLRTFIGDGQSFEEFRAATPTSSIVSGIVGSILSGILSGFIVSCLFHSKSRRYKHAFTSQVSITWWLLALFLPALMFFSGIILDGLLYCNWHMLFYRDFLSADRFIYICLSFCYTFIVIGIGEETGWRGYLLPEFQKKYSPLISSLFLGFFWAVWHWPLFIIQAYPQSDGLVGIIGYFIFVPLLSIIFTGFYNSTKGNLLLVIILHTVINNIDLIMPETGLLLLLLLITAILFVWHRKMWKSLAVT